MFDKFTSIFAPHLCIACQSEGSVVCDICFSDIIQPKAATCHVCNALSEEYRTCTKCRDKTSAKQVYVAAHYEGHTKDLLKALKYQRLREAGDVCGRILDAQLPTLDIDIVTWVPSASSRYRARGYNPSALIARSFAAQRAIPYVELLGRIGQERQVGNSRAARLRQLRGSIYPLNQALISGKRILLIDDVVTTGATLHECSRVLREAGANKIISAVVAKN